MIGQTISHYMIVEKLGEGGMGIVYKAHDTTLDRDVALKFLPHYLTSDATEKERFYHEARAASALNHSNITTIYEISEFENQLYLAMEFVEGKTLKSLIEQEELSIKKVLDIATQVCDGLAAAGEKGIVHRDIKSDNIMLSPKGQVKIMDFGLAKVKGATKLTKAGSTVGTAAYMSPEQAQGEEIDQRSDIFSFGVVLYELLTTKLPFRGEHQAALMYSLINEDPQPVARFNDKVSPELERIVAKALAKDREDRYQHIDDMLADLRRERKLLEYARAGYVTKTSVVQAPPVKRWKRNVAKYLIPAATLVIAVLFFAIFNPFNFQISTQEGTASSGKNSLAVMYFENIPDPEDQDHTGEMLTNLLTTSLFQMRGMEVISRERLYDIQKELGQTDARAIPPSMATNVAQRAGVSMMLLGTILQKEPSLTVTYRLIEVQTGKILSTQRLSGFLTDKIFSLVDTLALLVKNDLNLVPSASSEAKPITSVTTTSAEAYRSYLEGVELNDRFYASEATAAFRRAIELDSNFAMAYFHLATVSLSDLSDQEINSALKKASALSENVTERERLAIQATYAADVDNNLPKAITDLERLLQQYPHEQSAYLGLGFYYQRLAKYEDQAQSFLRGLQSDSLDKNLWNVLAYSYAGLNKKQEAFRAINRYLQLAPAEANPYDSKGDIYALFDDSDSAVVWWRKALSFRSDFPSAVKIATSVLVRQDYDAAEKYFRQFAASKHEEENLYNEIAPIVLLVHRGQLEKGRSNFRKALASHRTHNLQEWITDDLGGIIALDYELRDYDAMVKDARLLSVELRKDPSNVMYGRPTLAIAQLKNGATATAYEIMDDVKDAVSEEVPAERARYEYGMGILSSEEGKYAIALERFNNAIKSVYPNHPPLYHHAVCQLKAGHRGEALSNLQRLSRYAPIDNSAFDLDRLPMTDFWSWLIAVVKAHYWLGVAYEQQGQNDQAIKEYDKFLEIWKDADFNSLEMQDAKGRVARLKGIVSK